MISTENSSGPNPRSKKKLIRAEISSLPPYPTYEQCNGLIAIEFLAYGFFHIISLNMLLQGILYDFISPKPQSKQTNKRLSGVCSLPPHLTYEQCDGLIAMGSLAYGFFSYHFHKYALAPHVSIVHSQLFHFPMMNEDVASLKFDFL